MCIKEQEKKAGERGSHSRERSAQSMNGSRVAGASRMEAGDGQGKAPSLLRPFLKHQLPHVYILGLK